MSFFKTEFAKLKKLTLRQKLVYIKDYYLIYVIITLIFGYIGISLLFGVLKKDPLLDVFFVNNPLFEEEGTKFENDFYKYANIKGRDYITLDTSLFIDSSDLNDLSTNSHLAKLNILFATSNIDILVSDKIILNLFNSRNYLANLNDILPKDLLLKIGADINHSLFGVDISKSPTFIKYIQSTRPVYFSVPVTGNNIDYIIKFLKYLYNL